MTVEACGANPVVGFPKPDTGRIRASRPGFRNFPCCVRVCGWRVNCLERPPVSRPILERDRQNAWELPLPDLRSILRHKRAAEAAIVAVAALGAIAVAHASRLEPKVTPRPAQAALTNRPLPAGEATVGEDFLIAFVEPVPGHAVVSPFGLRQLPWEGAGRLHEGVDISADAGVPVRVSADGEVVAAGEGGGYGRYVAVRHAVGLTTFYAHLGSILKDVKPGLHVTAGQQVGVVGSTGSSTGPHLHFEIRDAADHPLNPAMFLGKAFAETGDLPLDTAKRYSGRVRIAFVSRIPADKQALMDAREGKTIVVRRRETTDAEDLAAAERNLEGQVRAAAKAERIEGLQGLAIGPDGRPRAQLSM